MTLKGTPFILLLLTAASPDMRRAEPHTARWIVPAEDKPAGSVPRDGEGYFRIARIVPAKLFRMPVDATVPRKGLVAVPKGTLMVPLVDDPNSFCELRAHEGSAFACLTDSDRDGKLDTYFGTQVFNEIFLGSIGDDGGFEQLTRPVELQEVDPRLETPEISLELKYKGLSKGVAEYTLCTMTSWRGKYFPQRSCTTKPLKSQLTPSGSALVYGQTVSFADVGNNIPRLGVEYGKTDFEFSTNFRFP